MKKLSYCLLLTAYCLLFSSTSFAIVTNINSGATFSTIQSAVSAANSGDTLLVSTGKYSYISVNSKNLTIAGGYTPDFSVQVSYDDTILDGSGYCASFGVSTSVVEGLTFTDAAYGILLNSFAILTARHCYVENNVNNNHGAGARIISGSMLVLEHSNIDNNSVTNSFGDGNGGGVYVGGQSKLIVSEYSHIRNNYAKERGAGIYVTTYGYAEIKSVSYVSGNLAEEAGGGIYVNGGEVYVHSGGDIGYVYGDPNKTTGDGGGIYAMNSSVVFEDSYSDLRNNYAGHNGGGIYSTNSTLTFFDYARIGCDDNLTNYADNSGGGIYALHSTIAMTNAYVFSCYAGNDGGGIFAEGSDVILYNCEFGHTNDAYTNDSGSDGGAINSSIGNLFIINSTFQNNRTADDGAAVFIEDSHLIVTNSVFVNNKATDNAGAIYANFGTAFAEIYASTIITNSGDDGGGIWWDSDSNLTIQSSSINVNEAYKDDGGGIYLAGEGLVILNDVEMLRNKAIDNGGAIVAKSRQNLELIDCDIRLNSADSDGDFDGDGGGIYVGNAAKVKITAETKVANIGANFAEYGGGILVEGADSFVDIVSTSGYGIYLVSNNSRAGGGAIAAVVYSKINLVGKVVIQQNSSELGGGVFTILESKVNISEANNYQPIIRQCSANDSGGAVYIYTTNTSVICNGVIFGEEGWGNEANGISSGSGGGAIAAFEYADFIGTNCVFEGNMSLSDGGAIYVSNANAFVYSDVSEEIAGPLPTSIFFNNTATNGLNYGGAVCIEDDGVAEFYDVAFVSNRAARGGAVYANGESKLRFVNSVVAHNFASIPLNSGGGIRLFNATALLEYCTIANNSHSGIDVESGVAFLDMTNCIVYNNQSINVTTNPIQNVVYSDIEGGYPGTGNVDDPPLFADYKNFNYELTAVSPCKNMATDIGIGNDCIGTVRPQLGGYDMGAYELIPEPFCLSFIIYYLLFIKLRYKNQNSLNL